MGKTPRSKSPRRPRHSDLAAPVASRPESELADVLSPRSDPLVLILDGVQDPHNLGACWRTADAAGASALIIPKDRAVGITETVRTVACGAAESLPLFMVTNLARTMGQLKEMGLWLVGTADQADQSLYDVDLKGPLGLVMGAEGRGVRRLTAESCDFLVSIPMSGRVPCLNVSVATGVCLFEAVRQRTA